MKIKAFINKYFSKTALIFVAITLVSFTILMISEFNSGFADFVNKYISSSLRFVISHITGVLPFSLGEAIFLSIPIMLFCIVFVFYKKFAFDSIKAARFFINAFASVMFVFSVYVFTFGVCYNCTPLENRLELERRDVSSDELYSTAEIIYDDIMKDLDEINFKSNGASYMPYSFDELNSKLNSAYIIASDNYDFIPALTSNVKLLCVSPIMTYTHISGIFTYYTCEANINFNYPDYNYPFTMAHEMAHQRGIAPEDEANFIAFLICRDSDDAYIRYSANQSMFEYLLSALYQADEDRYSEFVNSLDLRIRLEMQAFSEFFQPYTDSGASKVADKINDTHLKASGQSAGSQSYGLCVDLACAYFSK